MIMITIRLKQWSFSDLVSCLFCEMIEEEEEVHGVNAWNVWDNQNQNDFPHFQRAHRRGMSLAGEDPDKISRSRSSCTCTQNSLSKVYIQMMGASPGGRREQWVKSISCWVLQAKKNNERLCGTFSIVIDRLLCPFCPPFRGSWVQDEFNLILLLRQFLIVMLTSKLDKKMHF